MKFRFLLGMLLVLWITLGLTASGQTLPQRSISGAYDCSAPGFAKQKLILFSGGRWMKGARFDTASFKMRWRGSEIERFYRSRMWLREPDLGRSGKFSVARDRVILLPLHFSPEHFALQSYFDHEVLTVQEFRIDSATGNLIEEGIWAPLRPITCTREGFF